MSQTPEMREAIARIIDPPSWQVLDSYLEHVKRHHPHGGYDPDNFTDKASLAKADAILALSAPSPAVEGQGSSGGRVQAAPDGATDVPLSAGERHELECLRARVQQLAYPCSPHCDSYLRELALQNSRWTGLTLRTERVASGSGAHVIVDAERADGRTVEVIRDYADISDTIISHWARLPSESSTSSPSEGRAGNLAGDEPPSSSPPQATNSEVERTLARRAYVMSEPHLSGHRVVIGFESREHAMAAHEAVARLAQKGEKT